MCILLTPEHPHKTTSCLIFACPITHLEVLTSLLHQNVSEVIPWLLIVQGHFHVIFVSAEMEINLVGVATNVTTISVSVAIQSKKILILTSHIFLQKKLISKVKRQERKIILMILTFILCVILSFVYMFTNCLW